MEFRLKIIHLIRMYKIPMILRNIILNSVQALAQFILVRNDYIIEFKTLVVRDFFFFGLVSIKSFGKLTGNYHHL